MKSVYDMKGPKSTTAWALLWKGKNAGSLVANWSDNPAGTVCTAKLTIWNGPLGTKENGNPTFEFNNQGRAGGYGYDKLSSAVYQCFRKAKIETKVLSSGNGETQNELITWGYEIIRIL